MKKLISLVLALCMILAVAVAFAQTKAYTGTDAGTAKITIENAAKDETYSVVKLFDATLAASGTSIAYQGDIPSELSDIFAKDADTGEITYKGTGTELTAAESAKVKAWAEGKTAIISAVSDGSALEFTNLPYGYYVVLTTQGAGAVSVDSTNPNATLRDKNTTTVQGGKVADKDSYSIGDTITYTGTFDTANYVDDRIVVKYTVSDTLPNFLTNVKIIGVKVYEKGANPATDTAIADLSSSYTAFDSEKKIVIPWADEIENSDPKAFQSKYPNGAKLVVTYTAELTKITNLNVADTNTISLDPTVWDNQEKPIDKPWDWDAVIKTYGVAIHKVDENGYDLPGAQFTVKGLVVEPGEAAGEYVVQSYSDAANAPESAVLDCNEHGYLYIVGFASDVSLTFTEVKAPDGYNKLAAPVTGVKPQLMSTAMYYQSGWDKWDAKGNLIDTYTSEVTDSTKVEKNIDDLEAEAVTVENLKGTELPSTGGIGTTIFYILGGLLVIGAAVILVARRKAQD